jgi:hypothetical protein
MMTLGEKQRLFTKLVGLLIEYAYANGYELTLGDAYRSPDQARANAASGKGIVNSLHCERLAIDLNLFKAGQYLTDSLAYQPLGEYWESLHPDCAWGGRFTRADGNHFSIQHAGRK